MVRSLLLLVMLLCAGYTAPAFAQVAPVCAAGKLPRCDQGEAYTDAARTASLGYCGAGKSPTGTRIVHDELNHAYRGDYQCEGDTSWRSGYTSFYTALCKARPQQTGGFAPPNGSLRCSNGCYTHYYYNGDGTSTSTPTGSTCVPEDTPDVCSELPGYYWHPTLNVCAPVKPEDCKPGQDGKEGVCNKPEECPTGMITDAAGLCKPKDNECPAGEIKSPEGSCLPGDGQCAAGEARGKDGTCKPDGNGDGTPDEEDDDPTNDPDPEGKGSFSGGDDCNSPPSCSGDAIMCGQARIQWRIECNTRRNNNITGGGCDQVPICTGEKCNAMEYAQLLQQWRTSCAVQQLAANSGTGTGGGDAGTHQRLDGIKSFLDGNGQQLSDVAVPWQDMPGQQQWSSGLGSGSCPSPVSAPISILGWSRNIEFGFGPICEFATMLYGVMVAGASLMAAFIVAGVRR